MDAKALHLQNRTFALIENGTWACKSGTLMREFLENELRNITILDEKLTLNSSLTEDNDSDLDAMADSLIESLKK